MHHGRAVAVGILGLIGMSVSAEPLMGQKEIALTGANDDRVVIGKIEFEPTSDGANYKIIWSDSAFTDHFLSMRPFKCVEGSKNHWCHVPYPYQIRRHVSAGDLTDLEYDLLFLWKGAGEYGINMWNGVYYRMHIDGDRLIGELHEMDMDTLSAPPPEGELRPVQEKDLHESDPESHWLPVVVIE